MLHLQDQELAGDRRQARVIEVRDDRQQLAHAEPTACSDDPEFGHVPADRIDRARPLGDEPIPDPVQHQQRLLGLGLHRYEAHARALHGLATALGIGRVMLVGLHVRLHVLWRHQPYLVAELGQLASPVMRPAARLDADEAAWQIGEELEHFAPSQLLAQRDLPRAATPWT